MMELKEFFKFISDKFDSDLDEESLLRKQKHSKEYAKYIIDSYKQHPIKSTKTVRLTKKTKTDYYVTDSKMCTEVIPRSLFEEIGVVLKRDEWYTVVIVRDFYTNAPVSIESAVDPDDNEYDDNKALTENKDSL